ncbi:MAG TPA: hypothetical protein DD491_09955, partial [Halieaceae bacterium]|nr:hypothetical protein [Halieaceae bacterium]
DSSYGADGAASVKVLVGGAQYDLGDDIVLAEGTLNVAGDGTWTFAPVADLDTAGSVTFSVEVTDNDGDVASDDHTISITDRQGPVAADDSASTAEDTAVTFSVTGNDSDPDGTIDPATIVITSGPSNGSLMVNADGTVTYTPNGDYSGPDSFTYTVQDNDGLVSNEATVSLTVDPVNDPPVAVDDSASTAEDTAVTFSVTGNDSDPDGTIDPTSVVITGGPSNGSLVVNTDGTVTYTPNGDYSGADSFTYTVEDNDGLVSNEATVTLTVDPANDPPVAVADSASTDANTAVEIDILGNDSDADGTLVPGTVAIVTQPANGTVSVDPVTGNVTYTPDPDYSGPDSFTYTVQDDDGNTSNTATVSLVVNDGDVTVNLPAEAGEGTASVDEAGLDGIGSDAASDSETTTGTFSYSAVDTPVDIVIGGVTVVENGALTATTTVTTAIGVLTVTGFDAVAGEVDYSYTLSGPITDGTGVETDSIEVSVSDDDGDSATGFININIVDDLPAMTVDGASSVVEGAAPIGGSWDDSSYGADGAASIKVLVGGDQYDLGEDIVLAEGTLNVAGDGTWTFAPADALHSTGSLTFSVEVTDNDGDVASDDHTIAITDGQGPGGGDVITLTTDEDSITDSATDTVSFTLGTDALDSMAFGTTLTGLDDNGGEITWVRNSDTEVVGQVGGATAVTLTLTPNLAAGTATVAMQLADNVTHASADGENMLSLGSIEVIAAEADGSSAAGTVNFEVVDDVPSVQLDGQFTGDLVIDEANIVESDTANFAAAFSNEFGADGQGATDSRVFSLSVGSTASGLVDTATGTAVHLTLDGDDVVGRVDGSGEEVFRVAVDANGEVTLTQARAVQHPDTNDSDEITYIDAGAINLVQTITDGDGDTAEASLDIGLKLGFQDDAPTAPGPVVVDLEVPVSTVEVTNVAAAWDNVNGGNVDITDNDSSGDGFIQLEWGTPASSGGGRSGYDFSLSDSPVVLDSAFDLGTFTHNNFPINLNGGTLDNTDLEVSFDIVIDGQATTVDIVVEIDHNETPNSGANPDDIITITSFSASIAGAGNMQQEITVGERTYVLQIDGFRDGSGDPVNQVFTEEGEANTFTLQARLLSTDDLPSAGGQIAGSIFGADGPGDDAVAWQGESGGEVQGTYGVLTVQADGSWTYLMDRDARDAFSGNETETFDFFVVDKDGDRSASSLTINLNEVANQTPIALDLDGDGVEYLSRDAGVVFTDQATGESVNTAWVAGDDGLLVVDANDSGTVDETREYVFTEWSDSAETDMEAVAEVFDSNQNQLLDAGDDAWSQFAVWRDADSDGVTDAGELVSLDDLGVESIALTYRDDSEAAEAADGDVKIFGQSEVTWEDGEVTIAEDTSFAINVADLLPEADGAESIDAYLQASFDGANTIVQVSKSGGFAGEAGGAAAVDQTITFEGVDLLGGLEGNDAIQAMIDAGKLNVDQ